ncbi:mechanosensitive ion channel family protein [Aeoliella sp. ICT_H6.2]|uniref:Mechanosensitive ion channel family protein n=1 Tax=Aeoliella straminimaris TaxID=2954799 RepID=A0A9X2JEN4_9BACT|nr:mechanosensitive ion channel family protein [Aeoliella straminimaris]MCO6042851.1 mechanosensitive ion channel family protein [Aeoliella straminimaris]
MEDQYTWSVSLVVGFPLAMLAVGELGHRLHRRDHFLSTPLKHFRLLVLPMLGAYLLLTKVVGVESNSIAARIALTALLIVSIYSVLSLFKAVVFQGAEKGSWQHKVPRILTDLVRLALVTLGSVFVLSAVWGQNLGQMMTALGVGSIVLGLALQEPLGNVFSGVFLLVERPVELGDWMEIDGKAGRVIEINWRSVHLVNRMMELIVVPNSVLAQGQFKNFSRPKSHICQTAEIGFSYDDPPNEVKEILLRVVRQVPGVLLDPPPRIHTAGYGDYCINYIIKFYASDYSQQFDIIDELMTRIWYASRRSGLTIPYPIATEIQASQEEMTESANRLDVEDLLKPLRSLGLSDEDELARRLKRVSLRSFGTGEVIVEEGEHLAGLHLIVRGVATMSLRGAAGTKLEIGTLTEGEFFGERALLSRQVSEVTIEAQEDVEILLLDGDLLQSALQSSPRVAREIGNVIETRNRDLRRVRSGEPSRDVA